MAYNEEEGNGGGKRTRSAGNSKLPLVSVIPDQEMMDEAVRLMTEAAELKKQVAEADARLTEIQTDLSGIAGGYELEGFRWGKVGFEYHGYTTRKTLSKEALIEQGVSADVIGKAYKESKPFLSAKLVVFDME